MLKLTAFNAQGLRINYSSSAGYIAACGWRRSGKRKDRMK
jgi:hypothetical protein